MKRRHIIPIALAILFLTYPLYTAPDKPPQEVAVSNFPDTVKVADTVKVGNLPAKQAVEVGTCPGVSLWDSCIDRKGERTMGKSDEVGQALKKRGH